MSAKAIGYPPNIFTYGTQLYRVYEELKQGERCGLHFQQIHIPEYRSRINSIKKYLETVGFTIKSRPGHKYNYYWIAEITNQPSIFDAA